jgi:hypothetical protein
MKIESKYDDQVEAVYTALDAYGKGDLVPWKVIEETMGMHRDDTGGWTIISRVRRRLLADRQIVVRGIPGTGMRLLTDREAAIDAPHERLGQARRRIRTGKAESRAADVSQLSTHDAQVAALTRKALSLAITETSRSIREVKALTRPSSPRNRLQVSEALVREK